MPRISILETIDELSENSNTSFNETKQNLKNKPTKIAINRLRGGWGVGKIKKRKSQSRNQDGSNDTSENGAGNIVSNTISVKENEQDEESELANKASNKDLDNETQIKEKPNQEYKIDVVLNENINKVLLHKEENNKQTEANKISLETDASSTTKANGKSLITSSFIDKVLDEILPQPLTKCELKDLIPSCGKMLSIETQCNLLDIDETEAKLAAELFCRLSCDEKTSKRIECLERDVEKFSCELIDLQKELLPAEDLAKFNVISKCFNEINDLLVELKLNCLKLQNIENLKGETEVENPNCCEFCHCEIFGRFPCERKDVCNFSQCTTSLQGSSMFDVQDIHDLRNPLCPNDLCYSQHYSLYRSGNSHNEEAVRAFRTSGKSYEIADENNDDKSIFTDNMPNISQSNAYNRNSITISNKQINDIQNQFYKENSNTSMNHQHISRHEAGRDSTISSGNKILKGSSFKDSISSTYPIVPATTNNLSNRIWQIIGNINYNNIALTIFLESKDIYYINVSIIKSGKCIGCIRTNETVFKEPKDLKLFDTFVTLYVLNSRKTLLDRKNILGHSFKIMKTNK